MNKNIVVAGIVFIVIAVVGPGSYFLSKYQKSQEIKKAEQMENTKENEVEDLVNVNGVSNTESTNRVSEASLNIRQTNLGIETTVHSYDKAVTFMKFEAEAKNYDVLLNKLVFVDGQGRFTQPGNFALWADTNGDGKADSMPVQTVPKVELNRLVIDNLAETGYLIPKGSKIVFELRADAKSVINDLDGTKMMFYTYGGEPYIFATNKGSGEQLKGIATINSTTGGGACVESYCDISVKTLGPLMVWVEDDEG